MTDRAPRLRAAAAAGNEAPARWRIGLTAALLTVVSWPVATAAPCSSSDCSYFYALHASLHGFYNGVPVTNFTYGPLGALSAPGLWFQGTAILAMATLFLVQFFLLALALRRAERALSAVPAALIVLIASRTLFVLSAETAGLAVVLVGAELVERQPRSRLPMVAATSVAAGLLLNVKASTGLLTLGIAVVLAAGLSAPGVLRRVRLAVVTILASVTSCFLIFTAATGQPGAWPDWVRGSFGEIDGFDALALDPLSRASSYALAELAILLLIALLLLGLQLRRRQGMGLIAMIVTLSLIFEVREGFVREDGHVGIFLSAVAFLVLAFPLRRRALDQIAAIAVPVVCLLAYGAAAVAPFSTLADLGSGPRGIFTVGQQLFDPATSRSTEASGKAYIRAGLEVPSSLIDALRGHPVEVDPFQTVAVYGYDLTWGPTKIYADYQAYTTYLDSSNAASVRNANPNRRILRSVAPVSIDGHFPAWESPAYQLQLLCSWHEVGLAADWQVLAPGPDRCGASTPIGSARLRPGEPVPIPEARNPGDLVVASITLGRSLGDRVATRLLKPLGNTYVTLDGRRYRLVVATAKGPLIVRVPSGGLAGPGTMDRIDLSSLELTGDLTGATVAFREIEVRP